MKIALKAVAKIAEIDYTVATHSTRKNPLFNQEFQIEEELINLKESLETYEAVTEALDDYPKLKRHMIREQKAIVKHSVSLLSRMVQGTRMEHDYSERDIVVGLTRLVRLIIDEALRLEKTIDAELITTLRPFLSFRQRLSLREWHDFNVSGYAKMFLYKLSSLSQGN
ncbi:MAG: hypothetical protein NVSMB46_08450 [Candidatus Saccharimonadales bacterium]